MHMLRLAITIAASALWATGASAFSVAPTPQHDRAVIAPPVGSRPMAQTRTADPRAAPEPTTTLPIVIRSPMTRRDCEARKRSWDGDVAEFGASARPDMVKTMIADDAECRERHGIAILK